VVLRHGRPVATLRTRDTTHEEVVRYITGAVAGAEVGQRAAAV
jgi:ABC-type sugar transport system ATPase subunit